MGDPTTLTEAEREALHVAMRGWARDLCLTTESPETVVERIVAARSSTATGDTCEVHVPGRDAPSPWCASCRLTATGDTERTGRPCGAPCSQPRHLVGSAMCKRSNGHDGDHACSGDWQTHIYSAAGDDLRNRVAALAELSAAAVPGPWLHLPGSACGPGTIGGNMGADYDQHVYMGSDFHPDDAALIVAAVNAVRAVLAASSAPVVSRPEAEVKAEALREAALSIPMGPTPDPADYLRECADLLHPSTADPASP